MKFSLVAVMFFATAFALPNQNAAANDGTSSSDAAFAAFANGTPGPDATGKSVDGECICTNGSNAIGNCATTCTSSTFENAYGDQQNDCNCVSYIYS